MKTQTKLKMRKGKNVGILLSSKYTSIFQQYQRFNRILMIGGFRNGVGKERGKKRIGGV